MVLVKERPRTKSRPSDPIFMELLAKFYRSLGDPTRLRILEHLVDGEKSVGELVDLIGSRQGRISSHLACLRQCGFAVVRNNGRNAFYRVADQRVARMLHLGESMVQGNAERIFACTRT